MTSVPEGSPTLADRPFISPSSLAFNVPSQTCDISKSVLPLKQNGYTTATVKNAAADSTNDYIPQSKVSKLDEKIMQKDIMTCYTNSENIDKNGYDYDKLEDGRSLTPPVPKGTSPLENQVAGHVFGRENGQHKCKLGFLRNLEDGGILKPLQGLGKGKRELHFYEMTFSEKANSDLVKLREFIPFFTGVWYTPEHEGVTYIKLRDLTVNFKNPCIMDVKVGVITYEPGASAEKIKRELEKFPPLYKVGFQLVGIRVIDSATSEVTIYDRKFLRKLTEETVWTVGLTAFFNAVPANVRCQIIAAFIRRIDKLEAWFMSQMRYRFIGSSLLFVYDSSVSIYEELTQNGLAESSEVSSTAPTVLDGTKKDTAPNEKYSDDVSTQQPSHKSNCSRHKPDTAGCVDSSHTLNRSEDTTSRCEAYYDNVVDLRMIDFTHVFDTTELDSNYLDGLRSLRRHLLRVSALSSNYGV